jgi:multisubunit Na+/H+ antiporter MnhE subunit
MIVIAVIWCLAFGVYLVFAGTVSLDEMATAVVVASLAALWAAVIRHASEQVFAFRRDAVAVVLRVLGNLIPATLQTFAQLLAAATFDQSPGRAQVTQFRFGTNDEPGERMRRAIAVLAASLTPDRFVVRIERDRNEALIHRVGRADGAPDPQWLQ